MLLQSPLSIDQTGDTSRAMTPAQSDLIDEVRTRFGPKAVITDRADIAPWETDWRGKYHGRAPAILAPDETAQAQAMVGLAHAARVPLVPQGGNTSMVGGATPPEDGTALILSSRRMNRVRSVDPDANLAVAEAGVILSSLHDVALLAGRRFPLTLGSKGSATIGGLVSTNAGGTQVLRWGTMRALVAGLEAILPDGSLYNGLAALKKDNRGYDLTQLLIGAEGTLGFVTAAALRLAPAIHARAAAWVGLATPHEALALLRRIEAATDMVESFEILSGETLQRVLTHIPGTRAPLDGQHDWHVLIEAVAATPEAEAPDALLERLLASALSEKAIADATVSTSEAQVEAFWHIRDALSAAEKASGPAVQHDISVPVAAMPDFMIDAAAAVRARFPGTDATAFGHLGDGNVHFHVRAPAGMDRVAWDNGDAAAATRFVHDLVLAAGGSISAEHGIGRMKRDELARVTPPARLAALRAIRAALDPPNLFNPGVLT